jgi:hypothetical protein
LFLHFYLYHENTKYYNESTTVVSLTFNFDFKSFEKYGLQKFFCGSGSALDLESVSLWIRIRIELTNFKHFQNVNLSSKLLGSFWKIVGWTDKLVIFINIICLIWVPVDLFFLRFYCLISYNRCRTGRAGKSVCSGLSLLFSTEKVFPLFGYHCSASVAGPGSVP